MSEDFNAQQAQTDAPEPKINIRELLDRYLHYWIWFVIGVVISCFLAYTMLRYATPIYQSSATILIQNQEEDVLKGLSAFQDLGLTEKSTKLDNEIALFKTPAILESVTRKLGLNRTYLMVGQNAGIKKSELYKNTPFTLEAVGPDSLLDIQGARFDLKVLSASRFELHIDENTYLGTHSFNTPISTRIGLISFVKNKNFGTGTVGNEFIVNLAPVKEVATGIGGQITLARVDKVSDLISVSMSGPVIEKNNEIITTLINEHATQSIYDKNEMTRKTSAFINDRMAYITEELSDVEKDVEAFKTKHNIVDVATQGGEFMSKQSAAEEKIIEVSVQLSLNDYLQEYLQKHQEYTELLPSNLGFEDGSIVAMTTQYNKLLLDRQRLLKNSSLKNPAVQKIDDQLIGLRHSMEEGLRSNKSRLKITLNSLNVVDKRYKDKIASVPGYEREFRDIERQQKIKETLYIFLLQKREENEIKTASSIGNTKIIYEASSDGIPTEPNGKKYYIFAVALGLLIPFGLIYLKYLLDSKVHGLHDLIKFKIPAIGEVPKGDDTGRTIVATKNARTHIAESFRMIRTNLTFLLDNDKKGSKVIMVTSSIAGEGKTFISINIGHTLSHSDKKVVVIGLDLRAPKIARYVDVAKTVGVTNYIVKEDLTFDDIVIHDPGNANLDYIISGDIPPNPSELLLRERLVELIDIAKSRYDYVILDTAPVALVADSLHVHKFADIVVYVARAEHLDRRMLSIPASLYHDKKMPNMAVLVNATDLTGKGYGYGYGYGYGGSGNEYFDKPSKKKRKFRKNIQRFFPFLRFFFKKK